MAHCSSVAEHELRGSSIVAKVQHVLLACGDPGSAKDTCFAVPRHKGYTLASSVDRYMCNCLDMECQMIEGFKGSRQGQ